MPGLFLFLLSLPTFAGWVFPPDFPPNDPGAIAEIRDLYLKNIPPELERSIHTPGGDWDELKVHGAAAGLVLGLELNHRRLSPANRKLTLNAIGVLLMRAIQGRVGLGAPVPDDFVPYRGVVFSMFKPTPEDNAREDLYKLLEYMPISRVSGRSAAGLIDLIARGKFLPALREDAGFLREEASALLFHALARQPPFEHAVFNFREAQSLVLLLRELRGPNLLDRLESLRSQDTIVRKFAAEGHSCEYELIKRKTSRRASRGRS